MESDLIFEKRFLVQIANCFQLCDFFLFNICSEVPELESAEGRSGRMLTHTGWCYFTAMKSIFTI